MLNIYAIVAKSPLNLNSKRTCMFIIENVVFN